MKRIILIYIMVILSLTSFGCNRTDGNFKAQDASVLPSSPSVLTDSADVKNKPKAKAVNNASTIKKLVQKTLKAPYLVSNDISFNYLDKTTETPKGIVRYSSISITGLKNSTIQKRLNTSIEKTLENAVKAYTMETDEVNELYCIIEFNYNNLLSISLHKNVNTICFGLLYQLSDGKRLFLKDLFTVGSDYVSLINSEIPPAILSSDLSEEDILQESFTTIASNQNFCLTKEKLYIIFNKNESGFVKHTEIGIPRANIDAYMDIIDKAALTQKKSNHPNGKAEKYNNIFITRIGKVIKTSAGSVSVYYPVITGIEDSNFQKKINASIQLTITKIINSEKLNKTVNSDRNEIYAGINSVISFNHFGLICINTSAGGYHTNLDLGEYHRILCFDLNKKKQISISDIFRSYALKEKSFAAAFTTKVKNSLLTESTNVTSKFAKEIDEKLTFDFIMDNSMIGLNYEDLYLAVDYNIGIVLNKGAIISSEPYQTLGVWCSLTFLPEINIEEFFNWD